jgi:hypothetical protein
LNDIVHPHNFNRLLHGTFFPLSQTTATEKKKRQVHPHATISSTYHSNLGNFDTNYYCICVKMWNLFPPPQKFKELSVVVKENKEPFGRFDWCTWNLQNWVTYWAKHVLKLPLFYGTWQSRQVWILFSKKGLKGFKNKHSVRLRDKAPTQSDGWRLDSNQLQQQQQQQLLHLLL